MERLTAHPTSLQARECDRLEQLSFEEGSPCQQDVHSVERAVLANVYTVAGGHDCEKLYRKK